MNATARQIEILEYIRAHQREHQCSPTKREIGEKFGIGSPNGVMCHLLALEKKQKIFLVRDGSSRNIRILCGWLTDEHAALLNEHRNHPLAALATYGGVEL